ncbi:MAG: hypothetical protein ABFS22_13490 [Pseudomonadota bacterium]
MCPETDLYTCWKCGESLPDLLLPLPRHEECPHCRAQLHVCRMCGFFDPAAPQQCREPVADNVFDKTRANFCGYFQINPNAFDESPDQTAASRSELDALFGDASSESAAVADTAEDALRNQLEAMFKK